MLSWLLDLVGTGSEPDFEVTAGDNIQNIFEEYGPELIFMFILGVFAGIIISFVYSKIKNYLEAKNKDDANNKE